MGRPVSPSAFPKDVDPHRLLLPDERALMRETARELRARAALVLKMADSFDVATTVSDVLLVEVQYDAAIANLVKHERVW
jgi:IS4 transposase